MGFAAAAVERFALKMAAGATAAPAGNERYGLVGGGGAVSWGSFSLSQRRAMLIHEMLGVGFDTKGPEEAALFTVPPHSNCPWPSVLDRL